MIMVCNKGIFIAHGLIGLCMQTMRQQDWTEFSWRNNVYNAKFSVTPLLEHGFAMEYKYVQWL